MRRRHFIILSLVSLAASMAALLFIPGRAVSIPGNATLSGTSALKPQRVEPPPPPINPFTGLPCSEGQPTRPLAVMLAGDTVARPLSGIAAADLVVEMPVITYGINRFLAVYSCSGVFDIGSVRSARDDYIPLAAAFDAIYAHWGGSHFALDQLRRKIINNLDALQNPYGAFFRKRGIPAPHNGFTTLERLFNAAAKLGYQTAPLEVEWFLHQKAPSGAPPASTITVQYFGPYRVQWAYDPKTKTYLRSRGGTPEKDKNTGAQVAVNNIVVMRTTSRQIEGQYNDVRVTGSGEATAYRDGVAIAGRWEKADTPLSAPLRFLDAEGKITPFAKGPVWLEIIQKDTVVTASP